MKRPKVFVLKRASDEFPADTGVNPGDMVLMHSGDVQVWDGVWWHLLPGRTLSLEELRAFLGYVGTGWPTLEEARADMGQVLPDYFLSRMLPVCAKLKAQSEKEPVYQTGP